MPFCGYHAKSVYSIDRKVFTSLGVKAILVDRDNTLDAYDALHPRKEAYKLKEECLSSGLKMFVLSNNHSKALVSYCEEFGLPYLLSAHKPFRGRVKNFLEKQGVSLEECVLIGDQLLTDYKLAKRLDIPIILTEPLIEKDHFVTRFVRWYDRMKRKSMLRKGRLKEIGSREEIV